MLIIISKIGVVLFLIINFTYTPIILSNEYDISFEDGVIYLSNYIASDEFAKLCNNYSDIELVDTLYCKAIQFFNNDISESLLALTFSTLPFNKMPVSIPFINTKIYLQLPSVNEKLFQLKKSNLPGIVFFDSRLKGGKDKDKVAHFFGNAFLSYNSTFIKISKFMGFFVELFEETFKVSGGIDLRDLQTNHLGDCFGNALKSDSTVYPSDYFKIYSLFYFAYN